MSDSTKTQLLPRAVKTRKRSGVIRFDKENLVSELLSLGHERITPEIAKQVSEGVEREVNQRQLQKASPEVVSDLVAYELGRLGLIQYQGRRCLEGDPSLSSEVLEVLAPKAKDELNPTIRKVNLSRESLNFTEEGKQLFRNTICGEESIEAFLHRVARQVADMDRPYQKSTGIEETTTEFYNLLCTTKFLPELSLLKSIGLNQTPLIDSPVLSVGNTTESVFEALKQAVLLHEQDSPCRLIFGPSQYLKIFHDALTGGQKTQCLLAIDHPGILEFLSLIERNELPHFDFAVILTQEFFSAVKADGTLSLKYRNSAEVTASTRARPLFKQLLQNVLARAQPDLIFEPLSLQPTYHGAINLELVADQNGIQWEALRQTIHSAVHFLTNVINLAGTNQEIKEYHLGLGVFGFADCLFKQGLAYHSEAALKLAGRLMGFIGKEAELAESALAQERGGESQRGAGRRHHKLTMIGETKTLGMLAGCEAGIEPVQIPAEGSIGSSVWRAFMLYLKQEHLYSDTLIATIRESQSLAGLNQIPVTLRSLFKTSADIDPEWHLQMQSAFQKHTEGTVCKQIPLFVDNREEEVGQIFLTAHQLGLKGVQFRPCKKDEKTAQVHLTKTHLTEANLTKASLPTRPNLIAGLTKRIDCACGSFYLTFNEGDDRLVEILLRLEKPSGCLPAGLDAMARLVNLCLKSGKHPKEIARELNNSECHAHTQSQTEPSTQSFAIALSQALAECVDSGEEKKSADDEPIENALLLAASSSYFEPLQALEETWDKRSCLVCGGKLLLAGNQIYCPQCQPPLRH